MIACLNKQRTAGILLLAVLLCGWWPSRAQFSPDNTWWSSSKTILSPGVQNEPIAMLPAKNGKVLLLSNYIETTAPTAAFVLFQFTDVGGFDFDFGHGGSTKVGFGNMDVSVASDMAQMGDRYIWICGQGKSVSSPGVLFPCLMRLFANGGVDSSFGQNGTLVLHSAGAGASIKSVHTDAAGNIYLTGFATDSTDPHSTLPLLLKLDSNGSPVSGFGKAGRMLAGNHSGTMNTTNYRHVVGGFARQCLLAQNGYIYLAGAYSNGTNLVAMLAKFDSMGQADTTFFDHGLLGLDITPGYNSEVNRLRLADDTLWFSLQSQGYNQQDFFMARMPLTQPEVFLDRLDMDNRENVLNDFWVENQTAIAIGSTMSPGVFAPQQAALIRFNCTDSACQGSGQLTTFSPTGRSGLVAILPLAGGRFLGFGTHTEPGEGTRLVLAAYKSWPIGQKHPDEPARLQVYPNPSTGTFVLEKLPAMAHIRLTDMLGKEQAFDWDAPVLALKNARPGVYCLHVGNGFAMAMHLLVIQ